MTMTLEADDYGRHTKGELTVDKIVGEYWHALPPEEYREGRHYQGNVEGQWTSASELVRRCRLERLATPQEAKTVLLGVEDGGPALNEILNLPADRRAPVDVPVWWDEDTPTALLKPRYPAGPPKNESGFDPEATVGILPIVTEMTRIPSYGEPGFRYDEPPIGHNTGATPLDHTILDREAIARAFAEREPAQPDPWWQSMPKWKQALNGFLPKKWWFR